MIDHASSKSRPLPNTSRAHCTENAPPSQSSTPSLHYHMIEMRVLSLLSLPSMALAVALADFPPMLKEGVMSSPCYSLYTQQIPQCSAKDFRNQAGCGQSCIDALTDLKDDVIAACSNQGIEGQNVIVAYLNNDGPHSMCGNAPNLLASGSAGGSSGGDSTAKNTQQSTSQAPSTKSEVPTATEKTSEVQTTKTASERESTATSSTERASSPSAAMDSSSQSETSSSSTKTTAMSTEAQTTAAPVASTLTTSAGMNFDTSSPPSGAGFGSVATATSTSSISGQYSNDQSGGGSPFDTTGGGESLASGVQLPTSLMVLAMAVGAAQLMLR